MSTTLVVEVELSFIRASDLTPWDRELRHVYADYLEENGRDREASLQRWLADTGRYPACNVKGGPFMVGVEEYGTPLQWGWKSDDRGRWAGKHFNLSYEVGDALNRTEGAHYPYGSRHEAELALLDDGVWAAVLESTTEE